MTVSFSRLVTRYGIQMTAPVLGAFRHKNTLGDEKVTNAFAGLAISGESSEKTHGERKFGSAFGVALSGMFYATLDEYHDEEEMVSLESVRELLLSDKPLDENQLYMMVLAVHKASSKDVLYDEVVSLLIDRCIKEKYFLIARRFLKKRQPC